MKKDKEPKIKVTQDPNDEIGFEVLATSIRKISDGFAKATASGLAEEAIVLLVHDRTKVGKPDIRAVLRCLPQLKRIYTK